MERHEVEVMPDQAGERLDKFVAAQFSDLSRSFVQRLIAEQRVRVQGVPRKAHYRVDAGVRVTVEIPAPQASPTPAQDIPLEIVYEDDALLVVNKPAGIVVHPAPGHADGTLVNAVLAYAPDIVTGNAERPGIVHRLDRDTSGLLVIARNDRALYALQRQFAARAVHKVYLALVHDRVQAPQGKIEAPIGRDPRDRKKMAVSTRAGAREAVTFFRVKRHLGDYTLLQVEPITGRTHQIRVHLAFLKHPVVGDSVYGKGEDNLLGLKRPFLHAWRIEFKHPLTGQDLAFTAPLPADLEAALLAIAPSHPRAERLDFA